MATLQWAYFCFQLIPKCFHTQTPECMVSEPGALVLCSACTALAKPNELHKVRRANRLHQQCSLLRIRQAMAALQACQVIFSLTFGKMRHTCQLANASPPSV